MRIVRPGEKLTHKELRYFAKMAGEAYVNDPVHSYATRDPEQRKKFVYHFTMERLHTSNGEDYFYIDDENRGLCVWRRARNEYGVLDFLIVRGVSRLTFLRLVGRYARGEYAKYPNYITHVRGDSMTVRGTRELSVSVDGEKLRAKTIELKLLPKALSFLLPGRVAEQITGRTMETV